MTSKKRLLKNWRIYPVLYDGLFPGADELLRKFRQLLKSPVDAIQLRLDDIHDPAIFKAAKRMVSEARKKRIPIIINDRPETALSLGVSGVHLGKGDIPERVARKMLGPAAIIGRTVRGPGELKQLDARHVDYASIGPVHATPLKPGIRSVTGSKLRRARGAARMPLVAIGGINADNAGKVVREGIRAVAFARYALRDKDTPGKIKLLRKKIDAAEKRPDHAH